MPFFTNFSLFSSVNFSQVTNYFPVSTSSQTSVYFSMSISLQFFSFFHFKNLQIISSLLLRVIPAADKCGDGFNFDVKFGATETECQQLLQKGKDLGLNFVGVRLVKTPKCLFA